HGANSISNVGSRRVCKCQPVTSGKQKKEHHKAASLARCWQNLYLHKVFDSWMQKYFPQNPFERYADDIVCHCRTEREAEQLLGAISQRMQRFDLTLHPEKTKIVYCGRRKIERTKAQSFNFLGFTF